MQLHIDNMTCGSCARHVTQAIVAIDPDAAVEVDLAARNIKITSVAGADAIEQALAADGYKAMALPE